MKRQLVSYVIYLNRGLSPRPVFTNSYGIKFRLRGERGVYESLHDWQPEEITSVVSSEFERVRELFYCTLYRVS